MKSSVLVRVVASIVALVDVVRVAEGFVSPRPLFAAQSPSVSRVRVVVRSTGTEKEVDKATQTTTLATTTTPLTGGQIRPVPTKKTKKRKLGLVTFDLDDTLYPIDTVIQEANDAFAKAMASFGYTGIQPTDIDRVGKIVRYEMDPEKALSATHTEIRMLAIRREMERCIWERKLQDTAQDWATDLTSLSPIVRESAKRWATSAVSPSMVQAVHNAWEMERHHAAERHLYPEIMDVLARIKRDHPNVVIGAVTDGKANPLLMTFTLAKYFDFCVSWEDDQKARTQYFKDLAKVEGNAELTWIYDAAYEKYRELSTAAAGLCNTHDDCTEDGGDSATNQAGSDQDQDDEPVWIHVGDDLGYDVGGSHASGALTIWLELDDSYGQTARKRFDNLDNEQPAWSTSTRGELERRKQLNEQAINKVNARVAFLSQLPETIDQLLSGNMQNAK